MWIKPRRFNTLHYGSIAHYERQNRISPDGGWADFEVFRYVGKNLRPLFVIVYDRRFVIAQSDDCEALLAAEWKYAVEKIPLIAQNSQPPLINSKQREKWLLKHVAAIAQGLKAKNKAQPVPVSPAPSAVTIAPEEDEWDFSDEDEPVQSSEASPAQPVSTSSSTSSLSSTPNPKAFRNNSGSRATKNSTESLATVSPIIGQPQPRTSSPVAGMPPTLLSTRDNTRPNSTPPDSNEVHSPVDGSAEPKVPSPQKGRKGESVEPNAEAQVGPNCSPPSASGGSVSGLIHRRTKKKGTAPQTAGPQNAGSAAAVPEEKPQENSHQRREKPKLVRRNSTGMILVPPDLVQKPRERKHDSMENNFWSRLHAKCSDGWDATLEILADCYEWLRETPLFIMYVEPWIEAFREECPNTQQRTLRYIVIGVLVLNIVLFIFAISGEYLRILETLILNAALIEVIRHRVDIIKYVARTKVAHSTTRNKKRFLRSWRKPHIHHKDEAAAAAMDVPESPAPITQKMVRQQQKQERQQEKLQQQQEKLQQQQEKLQQQKEKLQQECQQTERSQQERQQLLQERQLQQQQQHQQQMQQQQQQHQQQMQQQYQQQQQQERQLQQEIVDEQYDYSGSETEEEAELLDELIYESEDSN